MEFLQIYLPRRVPSNLDLALNALGTLAGALSAALLERLEAALIDLLADTPFLDCLPLREAELDPLSPSGA